MPPKTQTKPNAADTLPTRKLYFVAGDSHICGLTGSPLSFQPFGVDDEDEMPHAFVHQSLGDYLIAEDRHPGQPARYRWADKEA